MTSAEDWRVAFLNVTKAAQDYLARAEAAEAESARLARDYQELRDTYDRVVFKLGVERDYGTHLRKAVQLYLSGEGNEQALTDALNP